MHLARAATNQQRSRLTSRRASMTLRWPPEPGNNFSDMESSPALCDLTLNPAALRHNSTLYRKRNVLDRGRQIRTIRHIR